MKIGVVLINSIYGPLSSKDWLVSLFVLRKKTLQIMIKMLMDAVVSLVYLLTDFGL